MPTTLPPTRGEIVATVSGSPSDVVGVFDKYGRALEFTGAGTDHLSLPIEAPESIAGCPFVTVTAWVKVDTTAAEQTILALVGAANSERIWFGIGSTGKWEARARAHNADTLRTVTSAAPVPVAGWHHVGCVIDIPDDRIYLYADGVLEDQGTADFGAREWFNDDAHATGNRIGANAAATPASQWDGKIHSVRIHRRKLTEGEFYLIHDLGKRGVIL